MKGGGVDGTPDRNPGYPKGGLKMPSPNHGNTDMVGVGLLGSILLPTIATQLVAFDSSQPEDTHHLM